MPANTYQFVEQWNFPGYTPEQVYTVLADARLLPQWWQGVYLEAEPLGDDTQPALGRKVRVKARGFLPYKLNFIVEAVRLEKDKLIEVKATGDFNGVWQAALAPKGDGTHVELDWRVTVEMPLIRYLSPLLKPIFAWNHYWTTPRGEQGMMRFLAQQYSHPAATVSEGSAKP
jgi:hypothetical protein